MNNMKNKILSLLVLLLTAATGAWADEVTIGEGTGNTHVTPTNSLWGFSFVEQIYTAAEIGMSGTIKSIAFHQLENSDGDNPSAVAIYMKHVDKETFEGVADYSTVSASDKVWEGTLTYLDGEGWITFTLDTPFEYNGTDNLLIACHESTPGYSSRYFYCTGKENSVLSYHSDSYNPDINNLGSFGGNKYTQNSRANIKIDITESGLEVTTNAEEGETTFTEAWFNMPANNVKVTYALARDMAVDVNAETNADSYYVIKRNNVFGYLYPDDVTLTVTDVIDAENPVVMTAGTDYTTTMQKKDEEGEWTDVNQLSIGTFRYAITGKGGYTGTIYSKEIVLKEAYEVEVAANSYATYYQKDALTLETEEEEATIYTIASIEGDKAILSEPIDAAPAEKPLLIFNSKDEDRKIILLSTNEPNLALTVAPEFQGTLRAQDMDGSSDAVDYYVCNKHDFVWVKSDGRIAANRCWIELNYAWARALQIVFSGDATGLKAIDNSQFTIDNGDYYDLNGRKVATPKRKGVYIQNGRKVIVK